MKRSVTQTFLNTLLIIVILFLPTLIVDLEPIQQNCIRLIVNLLIAIYLFIQLNSAHLFSRRYQEPFWKNLAILSPTLIVLLSFPLFLLFAPDQTFIGAFDSVDFFLSFLDALLRALIREMLFRMFFFYQTRTEKRYMVIIITAAIFAAFDLLLIFSGYSLVQVLIRMVCSFMLGLILGAIMEYGHCIYVCMIFHFLYAFIFYNACGNLIFNLAALSFEFIFLLIAVLYLVIMYFVYFKKKEYNDVQ